MRLPDELRSTDGEQLSRREREILQLVAGGLTNREIAQQLWVTETTVKFHLSRVYRRIGVSNRTGAAMWFRDRAPFDEPRS